MMPCLLAKTKKTGMLNTHKRTPEHRSSFILMFIIIPAVTYAYAQKKEAHI